MLKIEHVNTAKLERQLKQMVGVAHERAIITASAQLKDGWGKQILSELSFSSPPTIGSFATKITSGKRINARAEIVIDSIKIGMLAKNRALDIKHFGCKKSGGKVSVKIKGKRKTIRRAFVAKMKSGHTGVFRRRGKKRLEIDEVRWTTGLEWVADDLAADIQKEFGQKYADEFRKLFK